MTCCDLLTVTFSINDYAHLGQTNRYSGRANSWGFRSVDGLHILFYTKIDQLHVHKRKLHPLKNSPTQG